jgi:hypothetical protein
MVVVVTTVAVVIMIVVSPFGRCRGPHGPNVPRAFASLLGSGHSADDSSMPLRGYYSVSIHRGKVTGVIDLDAVGPPRRTWCGESVRLWSLAPSIEGASVLEFKNMDRSELSEYLAELGRKGGKARLTTMTPEQRRASARKAAKAGAKARKQKAKERKAKNG